MQASLSHEDRHIWCLFFTIVYAVLVAPTVFAIVLNRWFYGEYTIQMQVSRNTRDEYPVGHTPFSVYETSSDVGYSHDERYEVMVGGIIYLVFTAIYGLTNLGYCQQCKTSCRQTPCLRLVIAVSIHLALVISAICGTYTVWYMASTFIGIRQVGTVTVVSNTPGIILSVFPDASFWCFAMAMGFHVFFAITFVVYGVFGWWKRKRQRNADDHRYRGLEDGVDEFEDDYAYKKDGGSRRKKKKKTSSLMPASSQRREHEAYDEELGHSNSNSPFAGFEEN
mmetsp:Transcript_641/g.952  ORF Transcript_641/g.952 Transcript_641/m.952 type:complete len:280 (-) Transcript_641:147-986(-)